MAIGLQNYENIEAPDADYPNGNIKDNTGMLDGTPFDKRTYADIHQTFAKLLRLANITASGLPENEYNGFQYLAAMRKLFCDVGEYIGFDRSSSLLVSALYNPLVEVIPGSPNSGDIALESCASYEFDLLTITIKNNSSNSVDVFPDGTDTIGGAASLAIGAGVGKKLCLDQSNNNWIIIY
jgi:hypothetical protein